MRFVIAAILAVLFFSHADAANELKGVSIEELNDDSRIIVEALSEADSDKIKAAFKGPPIEGAAVYLIKHGEACIITLVVGGTIQASSPPLPLKVINKIIERVES